MLAFSVNGSFTKALRLTEPRQQHPYDSRVCSEQGFTPWTSMPLYSVVESLLIVSQKRTPGSADCHAPLIRDFHTSLALTVLVTSTISFLKWRTKSPSDATADMKSSVIFTEMLA